MLEMLKNYFNLGMFIGANRGSMNITEIVEITLGLILAGVLLPIGIQMFTEADLGANVGSAVDTLWRVVPVIVILGIVVGLIAGAVKSYK